MKEHRVKRLRLCLLYFFVFLTLVCSFSTFFFAIEGDSPRGNSSALAAVVGIALVLRLKKDGESE